MISRDVISTTNRARPESGCANLPSASPSGLPKVPSVCPFAFLPPGEIHWPLRAQTRDARKGGWWVGSKVLAERSGTAQVARCYELRVVTEILRGGRKDTSSGQPAVRTPVVDSVHQWGRGGLRPRGLRPLV